jgi:hypothetical protein
MKCFWFIIGALFLAVAADAQDACPEYSTLMHQADSLFSKSKYLPALFKYNSAKACSPNNRPIIDEKIKRLFNKIESERKKALAEEIEISAMLAKVREAEEAQYTSDSNRIVDRYRSTNEDWLKKTLAKDQMALFDYFVQLNKKGKSRTADSLGSCFNLYSASTDNEAAYVEYYGIDSTSVEGARLNRNKGNPVSFYQVRALDILYYTARARIKDAIALLPAIARPTFGKQFDSVDAAIDEHRMTSIRPYWVPDTVIDIPESIFARPSSDGKNFVWGYNDFDDYNKVQVRFRNLSLSDLTITTDSLVSLSDTGRFFSVLAAGANYQYKLGRAIDYAVKKSKVSFRSEVYTTPSVYKLIDDKGQIQEDFSSESTFFFSPDARYLATWKGVSDLSLYSTRAKKFIPLPNASPSNTESFAPDSKTIAYYNRAKKMIYFSGLDGQIQKQIPGSLTGLDSITNIDFTGGDKFLKVNNDDTICLFDIRNKKTVFSLKTGFVRDIVAAPNGQYFLIICNTEYALSGNNYKGFLTFVTDADLGVKTKLYAQCENLFFTPDGEYIIGYTDNAIMRWAVNGTRQPANHPVSCFATAELIDHACLEYERFRSIDDGRRLETAARKYNEIGTNEKDPILKGLYFLHSRDLFERLTQQKAKNIRYERMPFFYDWTNFMENKLGSRNFGQQFMRQKRAVGIFDELINSPDSVYPEQLYYAANGHLFLANLYDSLYCFDDDYMDQIRKELALRQRVFDMNPDNADNRDYFIGGLANLSRITNRIDSVQRSIGNYPAMLANISHTTTYLRGKIGLLPDSFGVKQLYIKSLIEKARSFLYSYAHQPESYPGALDSAINNAENGLTIVLYRSDSVRFSAIKHEIFLLRDGAPSDAINEYATIKAGFPDLVKELQQQLQFLLDAGAKNSGNIEEVINFLKNVDANIIPQSSNENRHDIH